VFRWKSEQSVINDLVVNDLAWVMDRELRSVRKREEIHTPSRVSTGSHFSRLTNEPA
jgi:hypothetical protein